MTRKCGAIVFLVSMLAFLSRRKEKKGRKIDRNLFEFNQYYCFQVFQLLWFSIRLFIFHQYSYLPHDTILRQIGVNSFLQNGK